MLYLLITLWLSRQAAPLDGIDMSLRINGIILSARPGWTNIVPDPTLHAINLFPTAGYWGVRYVPAYGWRKLRYNETIPDTWQGFLWHLDPDSAMVEAEQQNARPSATDPSLIITGADRILAAAIIDPSIHQLLDPDNLLNP